MRNLCSPGFLYAFPGITGSVASINSTGPYFVPMPDCEQAERQGFQMRKFKTPEEKRNNYIYYTAVGKIVIEPGMVDSENCTVPAEWITLLHTMDDEEYNAERRELYHTPVRFQEYEDVDDHNQYLSCPDADPQVILMNSNEEQKQAVLEARLWAAIEKLTEKQQITVYKKFWCGLSNVQIGKDEGVSEAAIRNCLKKSLASLNKKMSV